MNSIKVSVSAVVFQTTQIYEYITFIY